VVPGGDSAVGLHFLHRLVAGLLGLLLLGVIYQALTERRNQPLLVYPAIAAGAVFIAQAMIGAANIWTELAAGVVVTHLSLAALLWCMMVAIAALSYYLPGERERAGGRAGAAKSSKVTEWAR
jgi:heme A synthase